MGSGGQRPNARRGRAVRVEGERARRVRVGPARAEWAVTLGLVREDAGARVWRDGLRVLGCGAGPRLGDAAAETGRGAGLRGVAGLARVGPRGERVRGRRVGPVWVVCWVGFG